MNEQSNGAPFSGDEYAHRLRELQRGLRQAHVSHALITGPDTIAWLTGFRSRWYRQHTSTSLPPQQCVIVDVNSDHLVLVDAWYHEELAQETSIVHDFRAVRGARGDAEPTLDEYVSFLVAQLDLAPGDRGGMEQWSCLPSPAVAAAISAEVRRHGAEVADITGPSRAARRLKSEAEIGMIRRAQAACDAGIEALVREATPEMTELEAWALYSIEMVRAGGEPAALHETVAAGSSVSALHRLSGATRLGSAPLFYPDMASSVQGYHARATRPVSFDAITSEQRKLVGQIQGLFNIVEDVAVVGRPWRELYAEVNDYCARTGIAAEIGGYELGLSVPPSDWVGEFVWNSAVDSDALIEAGFVSNIEFGNGLNFVDTIVFTESGPEILSRLQREILEVAA